MNLSPEAFEQVLAELADRADGDQVVDRVPAVRRRARRNAQRRAGVLAASLVVLVVLASGVAGFGGLPSLRGEGAGPAATPAGPYLTVQLERDEKTEASVPPYTEGARAVVVNVILRGRVPQAAGYRPGDQITDNLRELNMGIDGRVNEGATAQKGFHCDPDAPLVDIDTSFLMTLNFAPLKNYRMLGPHELTFITGACAPVGQVVQKLTVVLK
jgi:hypothetical protein